MGPRRGCCCAGGVPQDNLSATHHAKDLCSLPFWGKALSPWMSQCQAGASGCAPGQVGLMLSREELSSGFPLHCQHFQAPLQNQPLGLSHRLWVSQGCRRPCPPTAGHAWQGEGWSGMAGLGLTISWFLSVNLLLSFLFLRGCRL